MVTLVGAITVILPGVRQRAKYNQVIGGGAGEGAGFVIVRVAIRAWARMFEELRIYRRSTRVGRRERVAATKLRSVECLTRASTRHTPSPTSTRYPELRRARSVQVHQAPGGGTTASRPSFGDDQHRKIVAVHQADVVEIKPIGAVQRELRQRGRRLRAPAGALNFSRPTIAGQARELPIGIYPTEGPTP